MTTTPEYRHGTANATSQAPDGPPEGPEGPPATRQQGRLPMSGRIPVPGRRTIGRADSKGKVGGQMSKTEAWRRLHPSAAKVLTVLWEIAGGPEQAETGEVFLACRVRIETIAHRAGMADRTVRKWLKVLREAGFVDTVHTGRSNGYNLLPFPDGMVADHDGTEVPTTAEPSSQPDRHDDAAPHITTISTTTIGTPPTPRPQASGEGVGVSLLRSRGVSKAKAEQLARSETLDRIVEVCAARDSGELRHEGGMVIALGEVWDLDTVPRLSVKTPAKVKARFESEAMTWRQTLDDDARRRVTDRIRKMYPTSHGQSGDDDRGLWACGYQLDLAMKWWNTLSHDDAESWVAVVRQVKPTMPGVDSPADDARPHVVGTAHRIKTGIARLALSGDEAVAERLNQRGSKADPLAWISNLEIG